MNGLNNYYFVINNSILNIRSNIQTVCDRINKTDSVLFTSRGNCYLTNASSLADGIEETVDE